VTAGNRRGIEVQFQGQLVSTHGKAPFAVALGVNPLFARSCRRTQSDRGNETVNIDVMDWQSKLINRFRITRRDCGVLLSVAASCLGFDPWPGGCPEGFCCCQSHKFNSTLK
jgi:hypothetical protein